MRPELSIVIPFYNEENNVEKVTSDLLASLEAAEISHELLLVDNGSTDSTNERIRSIVTREPRARLVEVGTNLGFGHGVLEGLRKADGDILGYTVGDGQTSPGAVAKLYHLMTTENLDLCKIRRAVRHDGRMRAVVSFLANTTFGTFFPMLKTHDINGTPKIFLSELYKKIAPESKDWFLDAEIMIKGHWLGAAIGEIEVVSPPRESGSSNVNWTAIIEFIGNLSRFRFGRKARAWRRLNTGS